MNMQKKESYSGVTIEHWLADAPDSMNGDVAGLWGVVPTGRVGFGLTGGDLREFVFLYIFALTSHGGVVIDGANDGLHYWAAVDRYGTKPEEIAHNVTAEWIDQGEPDPPAWESIAFALPSYLLGPDNRRD